MTSSAIKPYVDGSLFGERLILVSFRAIIAIVLSESPLNIWSLRSSNRDTLGQSTLPDGFCMAVVGLPLRNTL